MPRKGEKLDQAWFEDQVVRVFRMTSAEERFEVARDYCMSYRTPDALSERTGICVMAILTAAMVDIRHPLVASERHDVTVTTCAADILSAAIRGVPLSVPVVMYTRSVDSMCTEAKNVEFVHREVGRSQVVHSF